MKRRRSILALGLGFAADAVLGCSSDVPEPAPTNSAEPLAPAPVPESLFGVCVLPAPAALFELCRDSYDLPVMGSSWAAFAVAALGLPITGAEAFDLGGQVRIAVLGPVAGQSMGVAIALPLRAPDRLIAVATLGESARFRSQKDEALHGERLIPTRGEVALDIGVLRNHLVVGRAGSLSRAGAFLSDPEQPLFTRKTEQIAGWVHGKAVAWLVSITRARIEGKPRELLLQMVPEIDQLRGALESVQEIPFELTLSKTVSSLRLVAPKSAELGAPFASLTAGELAGALAADRDAVIALGLFQAEAARVEAAEWIGRMLPSIGAPSQPSGAVREALVALARARADGFQLAIERGPAGLLAYGSCDLRDEEAARAALSALTKASGESKNDSGTTVGIVDTRLTLIGEAVHFFVDREEPGKDPQAEPAKKRLASVLMRIEGGRLALATGSDAVLALRKALRRRAEDGPASLAELAAVKAIAAVLPRRAALFALFDVARWFSDARPSGDPERDRSALGVAVEVAAESVAITLALEPAALRALTRLYQGTL